MACALWQHNFTKKKNLFNCDNLGVSQAWLKLGSQCRIVSSSMRKILVLAAKANFFLTINFIPGWDTVTLSPTTYRVSRWAASVNCHPTHAQPISHVLTYFRKFMIKLHRKQPTFNQPPATASPCNITRKTYAARVQRFIDYCRSKTLFSFPASDSVLLCFLDSLYAAGTALSTANVYDSAIQNSYLERRHPLHGASGI